MFYSWLFIFVVIQVSLFDLGLFTGYPWTPWANTFIQAQPVLKLYQENSMALYSPEMDRIREAVKEADVNVVLGFSERDGASLYIAQVTIVQDGKIANHRRKIKVNIVLNSMDIFRNYD